MSNKALAESKIDYEMLEQQRSAILQENLKRKLQQIDMGRGNSLRGAVLRTVVAAHYDEAGQLLEDYVEFKKQYPNLRERVGPHVTHCKELINAIRAKRNFPGLSTLSMSKQQEILDFAIGHFEELKFTLKGIEKVVRDEAITDFRSTTWVLRTFVYTVVAVVCVAFVIEFVTSLAPSMWVVFNSLTEKVYNTFLAKL